MKVKSVASQTTCETWLALEMMNVLGDNAHKEHCNVSWKNLSHTHEKNLRV